MEMNEEGGVQPEASGVEVDRVVLRAIHSDDWAICRVAELRASGEKATFRIEWKTVEGRRHYGVTVRRADGAIERAPLKADYVPSGQTMAALGWVPEKGEPGFDGEAELDREARALLRRQKEGIDGLDWDRKVLGRAMRMEREPRPPSLAFGTYDPPTYQGPTTYTEQDRFVGVGSSLKSEARSPKPGVPSDFRVDRGGKAEAVSGANCSWTGCGECDPLFPCHQGRARCLRLQPLDPWSSLNDAIDLVVDLGGCIDEGIEGQIFGRMQVAMQHLSLRSRKWLSEQTKAKRERQEVPNPTAPRKKRTTYDGSASHVMAFDDESDPGQAPPTADSKDWKIWVNCLQAPRGDVLFLADLRKLLSTIGAHLVSDVQFEADRSQVLNSFSEGELYEELRERSRISQNLPTPSLEKAPGAPVREALDASRPAGEPVGVSCNRMVADEGLAMTPCPACRRAWCQTTRGKYWVRCQCNMLRQVSGSSIVQVVSAWNEVVAALSPNTKGDLQP